MPLFKFDLDFSVPVKPSPMQSTRKRSVRITAKVNTPKVTNVSSGEDNDLSTGVAAMSTKEDIGGASSGTVEIEKRRTLSKVVIGSLLYLFGRP